VPALLALFPASFRAAGECGRYQTTDTRQQIADSRQQTAESRQQTADSRQQTADSRQETADSRQQTADSRQQTAVPALIALFPASFRAAGEEPSTYARREAVLRGVPN
jgi:hypothetical protein